MKGHVYNCSALYAMRGLRIASSLFYLFHRPLFPDTRDVPAYLASFSAKCSLKPRRVGGHPLAASSTTAESAKLGRKRRRENWDNNKQSRYEKRKKASN